MEENTLSFKAMFSLVEDEILYHLQEVLVHCYLGVLLKDLEGKNDYKLVFNQLVSYKFLKHLT